MLLRARERDVEDALLLLLGHHLLALLDALQPLAVDGAASQRGQPQAEAAVLGDAQGAVVLAPLLAQVGHAHHGELQPLGAVDRHQAHRVQRLGLERRLALARLHGVALGQAVDEGAQVAALLGLELARHPHELAHVGHAPAPRRKAEHVQVVAGHAHGAVDERLERALGRRAALGLEQRDEALEPAPVRLRQLGRELARIAHGPPGVAPGLLGVHPDQGQRVERQAAQRRGEHAVERELVERVGQRRQPVAQVRHLLLVPVATPADHVGGDAALLERALVEAHAGGSAHQQDDVAPLPAARRAQLLQVAGQQPRLGGAPDRGSVHRRAERVVAPERLVPARLALVHHEQVHARGHARGLGAGVLGLAQRLEVAGPGVSEAGVDGLEQLAAAAEVHAHRLGPSVCRRAVPVLAEDLHVGVAEAVDRLALVPHPEHVVALELGDQGVLEAIGVLELVHEHVAEALRVLVAQPLVALQQLERDQLEVLEVERRAGALAALVALAVEIHQRPQQRVVAVLALRAAEALVRLQRGSVLVAGGAAERLGVAWDAEPGELARVGERAGAHALQRGGAALEALDRRAHRLAALAGAQLGERGAGSPRPGAPPRPRAAAAAPPRGADGAHPGCAAWRGPCAPCRSACRACRRPPSPAARAPRRRP